MSDLGQAFPVLPPASGAGDVMTLQRLLYEYALRLQDFLRTTAQVEYKTIASNGSLPLTVSTQVKNPIEVRRVHSFESRNTQNLVESTSISWKASADPRTPGIVITELGGITAGTDYTIVLAIAGVRT